MIGKDKTVEIVQELENVRVDVIYFESELVLFTHTAIYEIMNKTIV